MESTKKRLQKPLETCRDLIRHLPFQIRTCPKCKELQLDARIAATDGQVLLSMKKDRSHHENVDEYYEKYGQRDQAILERLLSVTDHPLSSKCYSCKTLRRFSSRRSKAWLYFRPTSCSRVYGTAVSTEEAARMTTFGIHFDIRDICYFQERMTMLDYPDAIHPYFGASSDHGHQNLLPTTNILDAEVDFSTVGSWLEHCQNEHTNCGIPDFVQTETLARIRVVDVCARKLVPYTGEMEYVALSYVWGGKEQPTVRKDGPIPSELPLTIEHAMVVVKHLGYRFIWVDSVCIDQGDSGDQAEQIGLMHVIYSCATATLILLDSPHADSGIPGIYIKDGKTRPELPREGQLHVYLDKKKSIEVVEIPPPLSQALNRSMWSKRAWTYQEAVLSRRRIILTRHQLFWSCSEASFSEDGTTEIASRKGTQEFHGQLENPLRWNRDQFEIDAYKMIVRVYVNRSLSDQRDGLNAISAVFAMWEGQRPGESFEFGLPRWKFRYGLLWSQDRHNAPSEKFDALRRRSLPSWSWCGWQIKRLVQFVFPLDDVQPVEAKYAHLSPSVTRPSLLSPPLYITRGEDALISNQEDTDNIGELGTSEDQWSKGSITLWKLLKDISLGGGRQSIVNNGQQSRKTDATTLHMRGIVLSLSCKKIRVDSEQVYVQISFPGFSTDGDCVLSLDASVERVMNGSQNICHDFLAVAISSQGTKSTPQFKFGCVLLLWDGNVGLGPRTAMRGGTLTFEDRQKTLLDVWHQLQPRWEEFYFR